MSMRPPDPERLKWLAPPHQITNDFARVQEQLSTLLVAGQGKAVYSVNARTIYVANEGTLGPVAIKELRFETAFKRLQSATIRRHRMLCEFNAAACFAHRGGSTPRLHGVALEQSRFGLERRFSLSTWVSDAQTLTNAVSDWGQEDVERNITHLAQALIEAARCGLVHGRHSSENILVTASLVFHTIDFSHAQIFKTSHATGFLRDVTRVAARLKLERACSDDFIGRLFDEVAAVLCNDEISSASIEAEFLKILGSSKWRQRLSRKRITLLPGFPSRL